MFRPPQQRAIVVIFVCLGTRRAGDSHLRVRVGRRALRAVADRGSGEETLAREIALANRIVAAIAELAGEDTDQEQVVTTTGWSTAYADQASAASPVEDVADLHQGPAALDKSECPADERVAIRYRARPQLVGHELVRCGAGPARTGVLDAGADPPAGRYHR